MKTLEANNSETRGRTENLFYEEMLGSVGNFSTAKTKIDFNTLQPRCINLLILHFGPYLPVGFFAQLNILANVALPGPL